MEERQIPKRLVKIVKPDDKELFRRGFITTLGVGCALPIALTLSSIVVAFLWFIFGVLIFSL